MTSAPAPYRIAIKEQQSAHPTLHLHLPASFLDTPHSDAAESSTEGSKRQCRAGVLVRMPPGVYIDTHTFPLHVSLAHSSSSGSGGSSSASHNKQRQLVSHVEMLNASRAVDNRLARDWDFTRVELERAVGYSLTDRMTRRDAAQVESIVEASENPALPYEPTLAAASASDASPDAKRLLVREFTAAVVWLNRISPSDDDAIESAEQVIDKPPEKTAWSIDLAIPLHLRYTLPLPGRSNPKHYWRTAWKRLSDPKRYGSYRLRLLEMPQTFWRCDDAISTDVGLYQAFEKPDKMLSPMHTHLSLSDLLQNGGKDGHGSTASPHVYRLRLPARTSREPFRLRVPSARQEDAAPVVAATFLSLVLAALVSAIVIRHMLGSVATYRPRKVVTRQRETSPPGKDGRVEDSAGQ